MSEPDTKIYVHGEWWEPDQGHYPVLDPATEQVVGAAPEAGSAQVEAAAAAARAAFDDWSAAPPAHRAEILDRIALLLARQASELVPLVQAETGSTMRVATTMQVPVAVERFERYARLAGASTDLPLPPQAVAATAMSRGGLVGAVARRAPMGVVACITHPEPGTA